MADSEIVSGIEFVNVRDCWGKDIPIPRPLAVQAARSGLPVTVVLNADACSDAIKGFAEPRESFSELDRHIAAVLDAATEPLVAARIAYIIEHERGHIVDACGVRDRFRKGNHLRRAGYRTLPGKGYAPPKEGAA